MPVIGRSAPGALAAALAAIAQPAAAAPCSPRSLPAALDSLPALEARSSISFSATPSEHPGRAWVVRASSRGRGGATLEILRLLRQSDCNRYAIEARWKSSLPAAEYRALAEAVAPMARPPAGIFATGDGASPDEVAVDGTEIAVRLKAFRWEARRELDHYGPTGARASALFRALVARNVPPAQLPAENWRTRR